MIHKISIDTLATPIGPVAVVVTGKASIRTGSDFLTVLYSTNCEVVVLKKSHFPAAFWDLRSGLAGEILQKVSNYRRKIIILGDFEGVESKSLRDFIYESNRHGSVVFAPDIEEGIRLVR
jgi:hypothetical protein